MWLVVNRLTFSGCCQAQQILMYGDFVFGLQTCSLEQTEPGMEFLKMCLGGFSLFKVNLLWKVVLELLNFKITRFGSYSKSLTFPQPALYSYCLCDDSDGQNANFCFCVNCQLLLSNSRPLSSKHYYKNVWTVGFQTFSLCGVVLSKWYSSKQVNTDTFQCILSDWKLANSAILFKHLKKVSVGLSPLSKGQRQIISIPEKWLCWRKMCWSFSCFVI